MQHFKLFVQEAKIKIEKQSLELRSIRPLILCSESRQQAFYYCLLSLPTCPPALSTRKALFISDSVHKLDQLFCLTELANPVRVTWQGIMTSESGGELRSKLRTGWRLHEGIICQISLRTKMWLSTDCPWSARGERGREARGNSHNILALYRKKNLWFWK